MRNSALIASLCFTLFAPILVANCSSGAMQSAADKPAYSSTASNEGDQPSPATALASADASTSDYRISPRDILDITVFQVSDLTKTIQVSDDGNVSLPLIGKATLGGKTTHAAEELIASKLRKKYLQSPQVSVFVKQYGQRVTVNGEVKTPRVMTLEGSLTLTQVIANAGGFTELADPKRVHIARASGGHVADRVFDLDEIQSGRANDPTLQGGDLVVAEQSGARVAFKNIKDMLPFAILASVI